jgi:biotin carboxylase
MKEHFVRSGIPVPWFSRVESAAQLRDLAGKADFPLVLKPVDSRGARGVLRLGNQVNLEWAYQHSLKYSPTQRLMVEQYLEGPQISTESVLVEGRAYTPGFSDRNYEYLDRFSPYMIENGGEMPTRLKDKEKQLVVQMAEDAARALGIETGVAKGDMVLTNDGPKVIEVAARLSGGWFSTDQIPLATGVDIVGAAIRLAVGEPVDEKKLVPSYQKGVAIRYFFPKPGKVVEINRGEVFNKTPWVHRIGFFVRPGDIVERASDHTRRAGFVITIAPARKEAVILAEEVVKAIDIRTVQRELDAIEPLQGAG